MAYACIDIGSNTTRLLVAEPSDDRLRELMTQRAFTSIGKSLSKGRIPVEKIEETAEVVAKQARLAQELGAENIAVVATAAVRTAKNRDEFGAAVEAECGLRVRVLSGEEEARLAFLGATRTFSGPLDGPIAVVDVGGGSTEIVVGTLADGVSWEESFRIGSGFIADSYLRSDPPGAKELESARLHVSGMFEGLEIPPALHAVATGGSANALRRLVGAELEYDTLERGIRILASTEIAQVAKRFELDPERVRVLPAGVLIFEEISNKVGLPLSVGKGGVREGVILDLLTPDLASSG
ncbi:MAG TPA: diol dehydratase reactivase ATPase-like domain-containing protein [Thermoleophilaceae bacterium]|nr:diol dehydratase reactivase ATPase-like domain-containing protein [Thermoleophilaceae bacterium]